MPSDFDIFRRTTKLRGSRSADRLLQIRRGVERLLGVGVGEADAIAQQTPGFPGQTVQRLLPAAVLAALTEEGTTGAKIRPGPAGGASTALLDTEVLSATGSGTLT